jgi:hypothetical protein
VRDDQGHGSRQMREDLAGPVWTSLFEE